MKRVEMSVKTSRLSQPITGVQHYEYGTPVDVYTVKVKVEGSRDERTSVTGFQVLSYQVTDGKLGLQAVAKSLGHGCPSGIDERSFRYDTYKELGFVSCKHGNTKFSKPVLALSQQTAGYRVAWGGVCDAYLEELEVDDWDEEDVTDWTHDVYLLRTNLADGGVLIQSSSSGAIIRAEKKGHTWTLSLQMPVDADGVVRGRGYEAMFRAGYNYYCDKATKA